MIPILLYEGVSAFEAVGALAALRAAQLDAELVSEDALVQPREGGARLVPARLGYAAIEAAPAVVLPGGDVKRALHDAPLAKALRARRGSWVLAAGEAVQLAAHAGLTEGRRVAVAPGGAAPPGAIAAHARLVADGRLLTGTGGDAIVDLALHYVRHEHGDDVAARAAAVLGREYRPFALGSDPV
jgi:AraC family transcriptional activator FtrA